MRRSTSRGSLPHRAALEIFGATDETRSGPSVADALLARSLPLVDERPDLARPKILAEKRPTMSDFAQVPTSTKAVLLVFSARTGREDQAAEALRRSKDLAVEESGTTAWFAFRSDNNTFGIFDVFPGQHDRIRHLTGRIASALVAGCPSMVTGLKTFRLAEVLSNSLAKPRPKTDERLP